MNKMPTQSPKWSEEQKAYWFRHLELINVLSRIGPRLNATVRLDMFWFRNRLRSAYAEASPELVEQATQLIDTLVIWRTQGWEPPHKGGKYV